MNPVGHREPLWKRRNSKSQRHDRQGARERQGFAGSWLADLRLKGKRFQREGSGLEGEFFGWVDVWKDPFQSSRFRLDTGSFIDVPGTAGDSADSQVKGQDKAAATVSQREVAFGS